ncbi:hypothetical protein TNCV_2339131 [Trichonephila clavipes]|nr:hypothetical protein TNCV_2339131 [Trichonephila clavipes]
MAADEYQKQLSGRTAEKDKRRPKRGLTGVLFQELIGVTFSDSISPHLICSCLTELEGWILCSRVKQSRTWARGRVPNGVLCLEPAGQIADRKEFFLVTC